MEDEGDDVYIARCCFDAKGGISKEKTKKNKSTNELMSVRRMSRKHNKLVTNGNSHLACQ